MRARVSMMLVMAGLLVTGLSAQARPNLSGEWRMVPEKSNFGRLQAPTKQVRTITHTGPTVKIVIVQSAPETGDTTVQTTFTSDGTPHRNYVVDREMTTVGSWEGPTLVLKSTTKTDQGDVGMEDRYTLSDGGTTLVLTRSLDSPQGKFAQTITFTKK